MPARGSGGSRGARCERAATAQRRLARQVDLRHRDAARRERDGPAGAGSRASAARRECQHLEKQEGVEGSDAIANRALRERAHEHLRRTRLRAPERSRRRTEHPHGRGAEKLEEDVPASGARVRAAERSISCRAGWQAARVAAGDGGAERGKRTTCAMSMPVRSRALRHREACGLDEKQAKRGRTTTKIARPVRSRTAAGEHGQLPARVAIFVSPQRATTGSFGKAVGIRVTIEGAWAVARAAYSFLLRGPHRRL